MKFLQLLCTDAGAEPYDAAGDNLDAWVAEMEARGVWVSGWRLRPSADATTVRIRGGKLLVTDGPFAETKETILGCAVLECRDQAHAVEVCSTHPNARFGQSEVRAFYPEMFQEAGK